MGSTRWKLSLLFLAPPLLIYIGLGLLSRLYPEAFVSTIIPAVFWGLDKLIKCVLVSGILLLAALLWQGIVATHKWLVGSRTSAAPASFVRLPSSADLESGGALVEPPEGATVGVETTLAPAPAIPVDTPQLQAREEKISILAAVFFVFAVIATTTPYILLNDIVSTDKSVLENLGGFGGFMLEGLEVQFIGALLLCVDACLRPASYARATAGMKKRVASLTEQSPSLA